MVSRGFETADLCRSVMQGRPTANSLHAAESRLQVAFVDNASTMKMDSEGILDSTRQHGDAVLVPLTLANEDLGPRELMPLTRRRKHSINRRPQP